MMDAFTDPRFRYVVYYTSARVGKTSLMENAIGYCIEHDPGPILVVQPTESDVREWSKDYLDAFIRDTPCLAALVTDAKDRSGENTILHKKFANGYLKAVGAVSPKGFRRTTMRYEFLDEIDGYPPSAGKEGSPVYLAIKRTLTVWNAKIVMASTPTIAGLSNIEEWFLKSNQSHFYMPCVHCSHFQIPIFGPKSQFAHLSKGYVRINRENPDNSCYICEACGNEIYEADRLRMIARGEWRTHNNSATDVAGFHLWEGQSSFSSLGQIARGWLDTQDGKNDEKLRFFINTTLGETYVEEKAYTVEIGELISRVEDYTNIPRGGLILTSSSDVQADRVECQTVAWGRGEESWLINYEVIPGSPDSEETWKKVHAYHEKMYTHESGVQMKSVCRFIDSSAFTHHVYSFTRANRIYNYWSIKGDDGRRDFLSRPKKAGRVGALLIVIGVDEAKRAIYNRLGLQAPGPGFMHFNKIADEGYFKQLTSEKEVTEWKGGRPVKVWKRKDKTVGNEVLDNWDYCLAALRYLRPSWDMLEARIKKAAENLALTGAQAQSSTPDPVQTTTPGSGQPSRGGIKVVGHIG